MTGSLLLFAGLATTAVVVARRRRHSKDTLMRPILMMLLIELRSGKSVLAALQTVADRFADQSALRRSVNVAAVSGIASAIAISEGRVLLLLTQLAGAQTSGSSAADAVRRMLESDAARDRALQLAKTKSLPVRLMVPLTLLILPGVVLLAFGPTLIDVLNQVMDPFE